MHLPVSWPSHQFPRAVLRYRLSSVPAQGRNMSGFISWAQGNWQALGTLLIQLALLVAGIWFARNFLRTMRGFQEQVGALLRLSITTTTPAELHSSGANAKHSLAEASPYWLTPSETLIGSAPEPTDIGPSRFVVVWHGLVRWLQAPMSTPGAGHWRRLVHWLQAPAGN
jgi:hypothetical protein